MLPFYHRPTQRSTVIAGLAIKPHGVYFDGTVGGGGHSFAILESDPTVRLIGTDRDEEAVKAAGERLKTVRGKISALQIRLPKIFGNSQTSGCGQARWCAIGPRNFLSSRSTTKREGFSYRKASAPLDMRMDRQSGFTAEDVVNDYAEEKLFRILRDYGEERFAGAIASNIVRRRKRNASRRAASSPRSWKRAFP